jgi:hypothetical protein
MTKVRPVTRIERRCFSEMERRRLAASVGARPMAIAVRRTGFVYRGAALSAGSDGAGSRQ